MSCNQNILKKDLDLIRNLANKFCDLIKADVRIYSSICSSIGTYYDFEPVLEGSHINAEIATIKYKQ